MKTAVSIPDALYKRAEHATKRLGVSRSELYQRALAAFLERHEEQRITQALNEVYGDECEDGGLDPVLEALQHMTVSQDQW